MLGSFSDATLEGRMPKGVTVQVRPGAPNTNIPVIHIT
jgi:hypothetical protein